MVDIQISYRHQTTTGQARGFFFEVIAFVALSLKSFRFPAYRIQLKVPEMRNTLTSTLSCVCRVLACWVFARKGVCVQGGFTRVPIDASARVFRLECASLRRLICVFFCVLCLSVFLYSLCVRSLVFICFVFWKHTSPSVRLRSMCLSVFRRVRKGAKSDY